jgi:putative DNA primase/helicase
VSSIDDIKAALLDRADALLTDLLGEPTRRSVREVRYGRRGSLSYRPNEGVLFDHEAQRGGSLIDLIAAKQGVSVSGACRWAEEWLSGHAQTTLYVRRNIPPRTSRLVSLKAICAATRGVSGTTVERYLQNRGIIRWPSTVLALVPSNALGNVPELRWWRWSACAFLLTDAKGRVGALQLVALHDNGHAVTDASGRKIRRTIGRMTAAAIRLPGDARKPLVLAEGPETALSTWQALGWETWAACGSVARHDLGHVPLDRPIVVCADDDQPDSRAAIALAEAVGRWREEGRAVFVAYPWATRRYDKSDFNDALQADGEAAVRWRIWEVLTWAFG